MFLGRPGYGETLCLIRPGTPSFVSFWRREGERTQSAGEI